MDRSLTRREVLAALGTASVAGCTGIGGDSRDSSGGTTASSPADDTTPTDGSATASASPTGAGGSTPTGESGGPPTAPERLPLPTKPRKLREKALSGGPPKDGIPSIDDPSFVAADEARGLAPGAPVFGVATGSTAKAYPQSILVWHEICNDVLDGRNVSVTYCPLTGTAMGFERGETTFGVSGRLLNNNLIMYDRATQTWWPQVLATAIPGPWNERPSIRSLREFRVVWTTWERWRTRHPDTRVLSRDTGYVRNYGEDPYGSYDPRRGYYAPDSDPMFPAFSSDDRLPPKAVVIGARTSAGAVAFGKKTLRKAKLIEGRLGGDPLLAVYDPDLDTGYVYRNPDGEDFAYRDGEVVDESDATHAPDALPLDRILGFDAMWFAWSGFYPDSALHV